MGRLQSLQLKTNAANPGTLNEVMSTLLGRQGEGAEADFLGHSTLEAIDVGYYDVECDVIYRGNFWRWLQG